MILKQLRHEGWYTVWLLLELTVVFFFLLLDMDFSWGKLKNYREPRGFDIASTYQLNLKRLTPGATGYLPADSLRETEAGMLDELLAHVGLHPDVEVVGFSTDASPIARGGWWSDLKRTGEQGHIDGQGRNVDAGYLRVFRISRPDGTLISFDASSKGRLFVSEKGLAAGGYTSVAEALGDTLVMEKGGGETEPYTLDAVCTDFKSQPFQPYTPSFFVMPTRQEWNELLQMRGAQRVEAWLRVREGREEHFLRHFEDEMGERLQSGQIYVSSIISMEGEMQKIVDRVLKQEVSPMMYVLLFVLLTAFLGVFGTFWLRTRQRRSEVGIRMAMGASRQAVWQLFVLEGLCLTVVAMLPALLLYVNLLHAEVLDVYSQPFTAGRVALAFASSLLIMLVMIVAGVWLPARQAARLEPAVSLHDE